MDDVILHFRMTGQSPQRFAFSTVEDAVESVNMISIQLDAAPECPNWRESLTRGEEIHFDGFEVSLDNTTSVSEPQEDILVLNVLMRRDVPDYLSGKAQAQSNHAGTAMVMRGYRDQREALRGALKAATEGREFDVTKIEEASVLANRIDEWAESGGVDSGFGTCIVRQVSAADMLQTVSLAKMVGLHAGIVHDLTYPIRDGKRMHTLPVETCAFVFGRVSECKPVVGRFPLFKEPHEV